MSNNATTQKNTVKMPTIPTIKGNSIAALATFFEDYGKTDNCSLKTWEKLSNFYSIKYNGHIVAEFHLSPSKGYYAIHTRSKFFKTLPSNGKVIKNGLDLNITRCNDVNACRRFIKAVMEQFTATANGKAITLYEADDFIKKDKDSSTTVTPPAKDTDPEIELNVVG